MVDRPDQKPNARRSPARTCDIVTVAAFVVVLIATAATVCYLGPAQAADRLGCGVVDLVNRSLAVHDACHATGGGLRE